MSLQLTDIISHTKNYGFIYPSSEIYEGLQAVYDYGPYGVEVKRKLIDYWWRSMTQLHSNIVGIDASILMHPTTWKASGHVDGFNDWFVDHKESKKRYRVDVLVEAFAEQLVKNDKKVRAENLLSALKEGLEKGNAQLLNDLLVDYNIPCPLVKKSNWTLPRKFNLMFGTHIGPTEHNTHKVYLRPETAQGIFVNFLQVQKSTRKQLPFGIAQVGKAFRNEIVARQFIFRMREFEQMEMQFFIPPGSDEEWFSFWEKKRLNWYYNLGIASSQLVSTPHHQLAHYAKAAKDICYKFSFGQKEVEGIHARGNFDLQQHEKFSKKKQRYFDTKKGESYIPHVVETSVGLDRLFLLLMSEALCREKGEDGKERTFLKLPPPLAPFEAALLPLLKKDGLPEYAEKVYEKYKQELHLDFDASGSIGKRYARQDLIGTPFCITIDHQSLADGTVTLRVRDSRAQSRCLLPAAVRKIQEATSLTQLLKGL